MQRKVEKIKGMWVVFELTQFHSTVFKTKLAEYKTKKEAENHK